MRRSPGILEKFERAQTEVWLGAMGSTGREDKAWLDRYREPTRSLVRQMTDEDLAAAQAKKPGTQLAHLAASEVRAREAWRGPARWALFVSALALIVSIVSIIIAATTA